MNDIFIEKAQTYVNLRILRVFRLFIVLKIQQISVYTPHHTFTVEYKNDITIICRCLHGCLVNWVRCYALRSAKKTMDIPLYNIIKRIFCFYLFLSAKLCHSHTYFRFPKKCRRIIQDKK